MGVPVPEMEPVENPTVEQLLSSLKTIGPKERRKHASIYNYWLSIRGDAEFPPMRDLDPLELSDAGPNSVFLEMIGGGDDAIIRHFGQAIRGDKDFERIADAPKPSLLASIHNKLAIVAACREPYAFEEKFEDEEGPVKCWVTLLPFSASGTFIDFVYGLVSVERPGADDTDDAPVEQAAAEESPVDEESVEQPVAEDAPTETPFDEPVAIEQVAQPVSEEPELVADETDAASEETVPPSEPVPTVDEGSPEPVADDAPEPREAAEEAPFPASEDKPEPLKIVLPAAKKAENAQAETEAEAPKPKFSARILEGLSNVGDFYGKVVQTSAKAATPEIEAAEPDPVATEPESVTGTEPVVQPEAGPASEPQPEEAETAEAEAPAEPDTQPEHEPEPQANAEATLESKLTDVKAKAEAARQAKLAAEAALYDGLGAAYDFALDAEMAPEEYLKLVEAQGLKIQLREPMKPVVRLAFADTVDEDTIQRMEAVMAWALKQEMPRGELAGLIKSKGGFDEVMKAA